MASSDSTPSVTISAPLALKKENITPVGSKIAELNESRAELLSRIQGTGVGYLVPSKLIREERAAAQ
ncbi:hypothetical protein V6N13_069894 [Hibiscus sabdariffa]|uniref:Uncharacterized protein n=1 Tax=Hibiscus sabdariffa TaxID=183260 RepID=A0ABR2BJH4_9ROSI